MKPCDLLQLAGAALFVATLALWVPLLGLGAFAVLLFAVGVLWERGTNGSGTPPRT